MKYILATLIAAICGAASEVICQNIPDKSIAVSIAYLIGAFSSILIFSILYSLSKK